MPAPDQQLSGSPKSDAAPPAWHALEVAGTLTRLRTRLAGLNEREVAERMERHGPNELPALRPLPAWRILAGQLRSVITALLIFAGVVAFSLGETADGVAIGAVLAINVALGFATELRGRRAMEGLRSLVALRAHVVRDRHAQDIDARALVPGDIIVLTGGAHVPADARLIQSTGISVAEASLTGESTAVEKRADVTLPAETALADRDNLVFLGTSIVAGRARAVVVATGSSTELGRIGTMVAGISEERTRLERLLDSLGKRLATAALVIAAVIAAVELLKGVAIALVVQTGIAVAVAAVPEGLPAVVTVAMAIGVHRMARRNALVRRLPSLDTLGATTVICTDKTRTLTSGDMALVTLWLGGTEFGMPATAGNQEVIPESVTNALRVGALASRLVERVHDHADAAGETPEDRAFLAAARDAGIERSRLMAGLPEVAELPFSSARRLTAAFYRASDGLVAFVKGAPGDVLDRCDRMLTEAGESIITPQVRETLRAENGRLADRGLRVLALAQGRVVAVDEAQLHDLTFVGFAGMMDPPAPHVRDTVARLREAGIRIVMLTGDHLATARAVARELGIPHSSGAAAAGSDIDRLTDEELVARVADLAVAGRVSPDAKLRIVTALQQRGEVVAMLGDGVNDAAALRKADIGVAMGRRGTDVAREAAGIVLADDRFETIAAAVEEGRTIFDNIRRFVLYLFSCNLGELVVLLAVGLAGWPLALLPLQLLWLNIVTDTFPALALAFEPAEADAMRQPPRNPMKQIMSRSFTMSTVRFGALIGAVSFLAYLWGHIAFPGEPGVATTLTFTTLGFAQLLHLGNARSRSAVLTRQHATSNRFALGAVVAGVGLQLLALYQPAIRELLALEGIQAREWIVVTALSLVPAVLGQASKLRRAAGAGTPGNPHGGVSEALTAS